MLKRLLPALTAIFMVSAAFAQNKTDYRPLRSQGQIPQRILTSSTSKYEADKAKIDKNQKRSKRKDEEKFYLQTNFAIDELLRSGKVLFNDPVTVYCNKVADELLKDNKELRNKLEFYAVKSPSVNAFTVQNGMIFINVGLIAQLESEAQLAFILSHEIVHYQKQHSLSEYKEKQDMIRGRGVYRKTSLEDLLLSRSKYSKQQETEADNEGLELYLKSKYTLDDLKGVFDVLRYAHLPFDEVEYKMSFLETKYLKFPADFNLKEMTEITSHDGDEDSLSTHPSATLRQESIMKEISSKSNKGRVRFLVGEKEFMDIQRICRYELTNLYMKEHRYESALYNTYLLMQEDSTSKYLRKSVGEALYGLLKYNTADRFDEVHDGYKKVEGSQQKVAYLIHQIRKKDLRAIATIHLWRLKKEYPEDKEIAAWAENAAFHMALKFRDKKFFVTSIDTGKAAPVADEKADTEKRGSKYEKIKKAKNHPSTGSSSDDDDTKKYLKYALVDLLKDKEFVKVYDSLIKGWNDYEASKDDDDDDDDDDDKKDELVLEEAVQKLGIVNPYFFRYNWAGKSAGVIELEAKQAHFSETLQEMAEKAGVENVMLDNRNLKTQSAEFFNDMATLTEFMQDQFEYKNMGYICHLNEDIQAIGRKYNLRYVCMPVVLSEQKQYKVNGLLIPLGLFFHPVLPMGLYKLFVPRYDSYYYVMAVDLETGESATKTIKTRYKVREDVLRSTMFYFFFNLKHHKPIK